MSKMLERLQLIESSKVDFDVQLTFYKDRNVEFLRAKNGHATKCLDIFKALNMLEYVTHRFIEVRCKWHHEAQTLPTNLTNVLKFATILMNLSVPYASKFQAGEISGRLLRCRKQLSCSRPSQPLSQSQSWRLSFRLHTDSTEIIHCNWFKLLFKILWIFWRRLSLNKTSFALFNYLFVRSKLR